MPLPPKTFSSSLIRRCGCGWFRYICDSDEEKQRVVAHPIYGQVTQFRMMQLDIERHTCGEYRAAQGRARERNAYDRRVPRPRVHSGYVDAA